MKKTKYKTDLIVQARARSESLWNEQNPNSMQKNLCLQAYDKAIKTTSIRCALRHLISAAMWESYVGQQDVANEVFNQLKTLI